MNIVLIGFMGSGKTRASKILAEKLDKERIEMDDLIIEKSGLESIAEIFTKYGEIKFRELETEVAHDLQKVDNAIISTGGGIIMSQLNMLYIKDNAITLFLDTPFDVLAERASRNNKRPLFQNVEKAQKLYDLRYPLYRHYADEIFRAEALQKNTSHTCKTSSCHLYLKNPSKYLDTFHDFLNKPNINLCAKCKSYFISEPKNNEVGFEKFIELISKK